MHASEINHLMIHLLDDISLMSDSTVRNLGVYLDLDLDLSFDSHINKSLDLPFFINIILQQSDIFGLKMMQKYWSMPL